MKTLFGFVLAAVAALGTAWAAVVDINTATVEELEKLEGIGPARARAIVKDRERNGPFASIDDLTRVPGISHLTLGSLRTLVVASRPPGKEEPAEKAITGVAPQRDIGGANRFPDRKAGSRKAEEPRNQDRGRP